MLDDYSIRRKLLVDTIDRAIHTNLEGDRQGIIDIFNELLKIVDEARQREIILLDRVRELSEQVDKK